MATRKRKRRLQFSLLTVLLCVTTIAVGLGAWQATIAPVRRQWQAARGLIEAGASVESRPVRLPGWARAFLATEETGDIVAVNFNRIPATDELVQALTKLPHLERLYMERTNANDQHAALIANLQSLRRLSMWGTSISDLAARRLANLKNLEIADLHDTGAHWRTHLAFQEKSKAKVKTRYAGWVELTDPLDIPRIARLRDPPVSALSVADFSDEELSQCLHSLEGLRELSLKNKRTPITAAALRAISHNKRVKRLSLFAYHLPNRFEVLQSVCRLWGPGATSLDIESHDRTYLDLRLTGPGRAVVYHCYYRNIRGDGLSGEDFASLEALDRVTTLRFHGYVGPQAAGTALALPNLKHISFLRQSPNFPQFYSDILPQLAGLESFHFAARLPWAPVNPPLDLFEGWQSAVTLHEVRIFNGGFSRAHLQPLREFAQLTSVLVQDRGFIGEEPRDILSELKKDAGAGASKR